MSFPSLIEGRRVQLYPLEMKHAPELFECAQDKRIWTYLPCIVQSIEDMQQLISEALTGKERGLEYPFVVWDKELRRLVGSTRFLNISLPNRNLEIGWTWYTPEVWRTRVNTECKYLLLNYCFEELQAVRVQLKADQRNERSNLAIQRIGALQEGVLRQDRILPDGYIRNSNLYSIIHSEWPTVKSRLEDMLR